MSELVSDTRAFLRLFRQSGARDMHLRFGDYEAFFARTDGGADPMRAAAPEAVAEPAPVAPVPVAAPAAGDVTVTAPHIASFVSALAVGSEVRAGDPVARIELLGEEIAVPADRAGIVAEVMAEAGALVEYSAPLVRLLAA